MPSKRKSKKQTEVNQDGPTFSDIFDSMDEETLVEMAWYQPDRFKMLCQFLTLDQQLELEEQLRITKKKQNDITR